MPGVQQQVQLRHQLGALPGGDRFQQPFKDGVGNRAHQLANLRRVQLWAARLDGRRSNRLVHDRERVAHRAVARLGQQGQSAILGVEPFFFGDHLQLRQNVLELDGVKTEVLAARADGLRNVFRLRRGQHENGPLGRLFQRLQNGVEGGFRDLVCFVQQEDLVAVARWLHGRLGADGAHVVDAAIGGRVDFNKIEGLHRLVARFGRAAGGDFAAGNAFQAGLCRRPRLAANRFAAVQRHGQNACNRGFADAAVAAEDIAVRDPVLGQRIHQGARDVVLASHVGEALRTVFPCQNLITHR